MKLRNYILLSAIALLAFACTSDKTENDAFSSDGVHVHEHHILNIRGEVDALHAHGQVTAFHAGEV